MLKNFLCLLCVFGLARSYSQELIKGVFMDSVTRQPVAFVNVVLDDGRTGTTSDIEGNFSLALPAGYRGLIRTSHVSYQKKSLTVAQADKVILLRPSSTLLKEVEFTAEENPAFRIIRKAIANKEVNNPENLKSYRYISYNKFLITFSSPTAKSDSLITALRNRPDTVKLKKGQQGMLKFDSLVQSTHFFLSESVTEKKVIRPDKERETLLALQVSGFRSPLFTNVATDYQPFTFYNDNISLLGQDFINPLSKGTFNRYDFYLVDTTYIGADSVYIIQYQPKKNKSFRGLEGILSISSRGYAVKNVIASTADALALTRIRIQQNYELTDGHWFPVQLNTDLDFIEQKVFGRHLIVRHKSFLKEISINPDLKKSEFGDIKTELELPAPEVSKEMLERYRKAPPDKKEARTYTLLDSALRKARIMEKIMEMFVTQSIPMGYLDWDLTKFSKINSYEQFRLGAGLYTNNRLSRWFRVGGYAGYGFGDQQWKYGSELRINFNRDQSSFVRMSYSRDLMESGYSHVIRDGQWVGSESLRSWMSFRYDRVEQTKIEVGALLFPDVHGTWFATHQEITPMYNYRVQLGDEIRNHFQVSETGFTLRYVRKENYMSLNGKRVFIGQQFPVFTLSVAQALQLGNTSDFQYQHVDVTAQQRFKHRNGSKTNLFVIAGWVNGLAPYGKLYNGRGATQSGGFYVENYFQTMGFYEFTASQYSSMFLNHNFGNILLNKRYAKPELLLYHNMGTGKLDSPGAHLGVPVNSFEKGFFESGVGLMNLLRFKYADVAYFGLGGAAFYRYGEYALPQAANNLFWRLTFGIQI
jgi:hypothetical protein